MAIILIIGAIIVYGLTYILGVGVAWVLKAVLTALGFATFGSVWLWGILLVVGFITLNYIKS
jgi:hypothetical protein